MKRAAYPTALFTLTMATLLSSSAAASVDLAIKLSQPTTARAYEDAKFEVAVRNVGKRSARRVNVAIELPATNTSPVADPLGRLGRLDRRCSLSGTTVNCRLGRLAKGKTARVAVKMALPYSAMPIELRATATTSSKEKRTANNVATLVAKTTYHAAPIAAPAAIINRHCTGEGITSFFECERYPAGIGGHQIVLNTDGSITFVGAQGNYRGAWRQTAADRLAFRYFENGNLVAAFEGFATSDRCFEGTTTFATTAGVALYEVCMH